jgi:molybdate-binding protein/DNA-binding transcriptional regulator YhcF (GntR family)
MEQQPLFQVIAEAIRREILQGTLKHGDELPPVREMSEKWRCAPGTVQHAYHNLAKLGLVVSRVGQGTRVADAPPTGSTPPLRRATLIHQAESFLIGALSAGHTLNDIELAVRLAMDRWRSLAEENPPPPGPGLRFTGSHDPAITLIAAQLGDFAPGYHLDVTFSGSLGGLIALARHETDLAGCHLWDEETDTYNAPFVRRLLPGRRTALLMVAHRHLGLIVPAGNPSNIRRLDDLARAGLRFINRQEGAGTRVWLDTHLRARRIDAEQIEGYSDCVPTHSEVASAIAQGQADVGLGLETAALAYGLDFVPLTVERYDLAIPSDVWEMPPVQALRRWLESDLAQDAIRSLGGYDTRSTGAVEWVN